MNFRDELNFLREVMNKCYVRVAVLSKNDSADTITDSLINTIIGSGTNPEFTIGRMVGEVEDNTKYTLSTGLGLKYIFLRLPTDEEKNILFIGPYLSSPLSAGEIMQIAEKYGLAPNTQRFLREYYATLPTVSDSDRINTMIDTFCEKIWQSASFAITEINKDSALPHLSVPQAKQSHSFDENLANLERMELRYAYENELIRAVTLGQQHKEKNLAAAFNEQMFEKRTHDALRNSKNYCIIMNTLLRKAAEQGGVHPVHIDVESTKFAEKIESVTKSSDIPTLMQQMFSSYCRLVRNHSTSKYSEVVRKTLLMIDSDISAEISLKRLAKTQDVTPEYLSAVFKKETGKNVTEYIRNKRMKHAAHLLSTTNLQIQTIAMHCGIMDVQYFSRVFKKELGKTPKEYRTAKVFY